MTTEIDTGGSAFPCGRDVTLDRQPSTGMTLRDYFAVRVLPMAIEHWKHIDDFDEDEGGVFLWGTYVDENDHCLPAAEMAYRMADAMIVARSQK